MRSEMRLRRLTADDARAAGEGFSSCGWFRRGSPPPAGLLGSLPQGQRPEHHRVMVSSSQQQPELSR